MWWLRQAVLICASSWCHLSISSFDITHGLAVKLFVVIIEQLLTLKMFSWLWEHFVLTAIFDSSWCVESCLSCRIDASHWCFTIMEATGKQYFKSISTLTVFVCFIFVASASILSHMLESEVLHVWLCEKLQSYRVLTVYHLSRHTKQRHWLNVVYCSKLTSDHIGQVTDLVTGNILSRSKAREVWHLFFDDLWNFTSLLLNH